MASADDTGPLTILTDEPVCTDYQNTLADVSTAQRQGWADRNPDIPATQWTTTQHTMYEQMADALNTAADHYTLLAHRTPHRIIAELLAISIGSTRAYTNALPHYTATDNKLIRPSNNADHVLTNLCNTITTGSATNRAPLAPPMADPAIRPTPIDPDHPRTLMAKPDPICTNLHAVIDQYHTPLADWRAIETDIPATDWTPQQRDLNNTAAPLLHDQARQYLQLAGHTPDPLIADLLTLAGLYQHLYARTLGTYTPDDRHLYATAVYAIRTVANACTTPP